jgi:hypothetical protein
MSNAKHTPGTWKSAHSGYANAPTVIYVGEIDPKWNRRYPLTNVNWIAEVRDDESEQHKEYEANARLFLAAPDLLAALKSLVAYAREHGGPNDYVALNAADAAIAKAEGRQ